MILRIKSHGDSQSDETIDMCDPSQLESVAESLHFFKHQDFSPAMTAFLNSVGGGYGSAEIEWDQRDRDKQIKEFLRAAGQAEKQYKTDHK